MKTKFIAYVTAGAIAVTGMTAPSVQAGPNDDLFNFIAGATLLAIIASGVQNSAKPQATQSTQHRHKRHHRVAHRKPPKKCLRQRYTDYGWKKFYSHRCLQKHGYRGHHRHW